MNAKKKRKSVKKHKSIASTLTGVEVNKITQRVFLYLHATDVTCCTDGLSFNGAEIELTHSHNTITTLSDHYTPRNIIHLDQFDTVKPTFSITIEQDSLIDITTLSDCPILLTLYMYVERKESNFSETPKKSDAKEGKEEQQEIDLVRVPMAQGHIDIVQYYDNKRVQSTDTVFLYSLNHKNPSLTCKIEWEIYSLHPLLKNVVLSNYLFISLGSLYNLNEELMNDYQHLAAKLSFISKVPKHNQNEYEKIFICNFKQFTKSIIAKQHLNKWWESLKSHEFENVNTMGIESGQKIILNQLFSNLLSTEDVEFNFNEIKTNEDVALVCNSMHRYVLTDSMEKKLEDILSRNEYQIMLEIYSELEKSKILLQGYIDLSIFMYPDVNNCSFAIELLVPAHTRLSLRTNKFNLKSKKMLSSQQLVTEVKIPFAIIQICLFKPITNPVQDITKMSNRKPKHNKFCQYTSTSAQNSTAFESTSTEIKYKNFDELILEILDYIVVNRIKKMDDDKEFFCYQLSNMNNRIMKLVASDFNIRIPTKTNIEFTNLITIVYRDLISRIYNYINKCSRSGLQDCVFTITKEQIFIVDSMSVAKNLYEVGNLKMANTIMDFLHSEYPNNLLLKFYIFLYNVEKQNFDEVKNYLKSPLDDKDMEGEYFTELIEIYVNYKLQLQDPEQNETAEENLIKALTVYSITHKPMSFTAFILLYCLYKKNNYQPGMTFCRWRYENLNDRVFLKQELTPASRWDIYMPHKINLKSEKGIKYMRACERLLRLGLYTFAQWIFDEIAYECMDIERYFFLNTFAIIENNLPSNLAIKTFTVDELTNPSEMHATLCLTNGNLEYCNTNGPDAMKHYQDLAEIDGLPKYVPFQLGLLRYAYEMMKEAKYKEASQVFLNICNDKENCVAVAAGRGKACYYLNQLDEAEKYFALGTKYGIYVPNTWAFLALINLKKSNNYKALECWKYSRLNRNCEIHKEIINELNKINCSDVFLYVDLPNDI